MEHLVFSTADDRDDNVINKYRYLWLCIYLTYSTVWVERECRAFSDSDNKDEGL